MVECPRTPVCELVDEAEAIVLAEVESLHQQCENYIAIAKMAVKRAYKLSPLVGDSFERFFAPGNVSVGDSWLVAFRIDERRGHLEQYRGCTDVRVEEAAAQISFLEAWSAGQLGSWQTQLAVSAEFDGITVVAESTQHRLTAISDGGVAVFNGIPPGKYIASMLSPGFNLDQAYSKTRANITEGTCRSASLHLSTSNRVTGTASDSGGQPIPKGVGVRLIQRHVARGEVRYSVRKGRVTDDSGHFVILNPRPGPNRLQIGPIWGEPGFAATFYPNAATLEDAQQVTVEPDTDFEGLQLRLTRPVFPRDVRVQVVWSDGTPAAGAKISRADYWEYESAEDPLFYGSVHGTAIADESGWAEVPVLTGVPLWLKATYHGEPASRAEMVRGESEIFEIEPGDGAVSRVVKLRPYRPGLCGGKDFLD